VNLRQLSRWLEDFDSANGGNARPLLRLARRLDESVVSPLVEYAAFETSLRSDRPGWLQLAHLHVYPPTLPAAIEPKVLHLKASAVWRTIGDLESMRPGWPLPRIEARLRELAAAKRLGPATSFSCEYDARAGRPLKVTLYAMPLEPAMDCVGYDFWSDGKTRSKHYRRMPLSAVAALKPALRRSLNAFLSLYPVQDILALKRAGDRGAAGKVALRLKEGISGDSVAGAEGFAAFRPFLRSSAAALRGQRIYYLALDASGGLEITFRRTPAPWA
jgi:hypothetical protein